MRTLEKVMIIGDDSGNAHKLGNLLEGRRKATWDTIYT